MDATSAIALSIPLAIAASGYVFTSIHTRRKDARDARLALINDQLANLYGPLHIVTEARKRSWEAFRARHLDGSAGLFGRQALPSDVIADWQIWMRTTFQPANELLVKTVLENAHLLRGESVPRCLLDLVAYTDSYRVAIQKWNEDEGSTEGAFFDFPDEVGRWASEGYQRLKAEQASLLGLKPEASIDPSRATSDRQRVPVANGDESKRTTDYRVELVICVDASGSMGHLVGEVIRFVQRLPGDLVEAMETKGKWVGHLRVRLVAFRDVRYDGNAAIEATRFYDLPSEADQLNSIAADFVATGGGPAEDSGLHALSLAIQSPWSPDPSGRHRSVIVILTDSAPHDLDSSSFEFDGIQMPSSWVELEALWSGDSPAISQRGKRLVLLTPEAGAWIDIVNQWDNVIMFPSSAGSGMTETDYRGILDAIVPSI